METKIKYLIGNDGATPFTLKNNRNMWNNDLQVLQAQFMLGSEEFWLDHGDFRISGGAVTPNGGNFDIAPGVFYLGGRIIKWEGATNIALNASTRLVYDTSSGDPFEGVVNTDFGIGASPSPSQRQYKVRIDTTVPSAPWDADILVSGSGWRVSLGNVIERMSRRNGDIQLFGGSLSGKFDGSGAGVGDMIGWHLCNGNGGTLDLRGRHTVAYHGSDPGYNNIGDSVGNNNINLTTSQLPAHRHLIVSQGVSTSNLSPNNQLKDRRETGSDIDYRLFDSGVEEDATIGRTSSTGGSSPIDIRPLATVVAYIQWVGFTN